MHRSGLQTLECYVRFGAEIEIATWVKTRDRVYLAVDRLVAFDNKVESYYAVHSGLVVNKIFKMRPRRIRVLVE